jgi:hypothetical protein
MTEPTVISKNGTPIRLPDERWGHIVEQHGELAGMRQDALNTVEEPERVLAGNAGELLAVREIEVDKWLVVVYREWQNDGFVITAFMTRRKRALDRRQQLWP